MNNKPVIVLVGMPGSGKTTLGNALSQKLQLSFADLDVLIEAAEGCTISYLFENKGEAYFRQRESELLKQVLHAQQPLVLATGGGTPCFFDNMAHIREQSVSVYIEVGWSLLARRLAGQPGQRPLLNDLAPDALAASLEEKFGWRIPYYQQADVQLQVEVGQSAEVLVEQLLPVIYK